MPKLPSASEEGEFVVDAPPGDFGTRVFIGGNYKFGLVLHLIKRAVIYSGYQPILVSEFEIPVGSERESSLRLLRQCKFAIFEVSTDDAGHMIEMERALDYETVSLCLWDEGTSESPKISAMVTSHPVYRGNQQGYKGMRQLEDAVSVFLNDQQPE